MIITYFYIEESETIRLMPEKEAKELALVITSLDNHETPIVKGDGVKCKDNLYILITVIYFMGDPTESERPDDVVREFHFLKAKLKKT